MKKKVIIFVLFVFVILLVISFTSIDLVNETTLAKTAYELPQSVKNQIEAETMGMDEMHILNYGIRLTASLLDFSEINDIKNGKANCVGYAILCKSICDYAYRLNGYNIKVNHVRGYVSLMGINLCKIAQSISPKKYKSFVKDHDFIELSLGGSYYYIDPSLYDLMGTDCMTIITDRRF